MRWGSSAAISSATWNGSSPSEPSALEKAGYPYDMVQMRWTTGSDNGPPDARLPDAVKNWNATHASPKLVIATTSELFREFEKRYADKIPVVRGDFTPYWEDGAGSSARETAINRTAAERLVQAETLSAMFAPREYPAAKFSDAWRNVILYDEHTWGAYNSISEPDKPIRQGSMEDQAGICARRATRNRGNCWPTHLPRDQTRPVAGAVDVFNTSAWPRTDLVVLGKEMSAAGDVVTGTRRRGGPLATAFDRRVGVFGQGCARPGRQAIHDRCRQGCNIRPCEGRREHGRQLGGFGPGRSGFWRDRQPARHDGGRRT